MSANSCDKENWRESWTNTDYEEAEIIIRGSNNDLLDGYKVVGKEGNYMSI